MRDFRLPDKRGFEYIIIPVLVAMLIRVIYHLLNIPDFWGDAYHNVLIAQFTVDNDWVYSDYKGREVVWLPFYRYLTAFYMAIFDRYDLLIPHLLNVILGSISCGVVAKITAKATNKETGALAGLLLAVLPWHVAYSHMNMPEITGSLIILLVVDAQQNRRWWWLLPLTFMGVLTRNEVTLYLGLYGLYVIWCKEWKPAMAMVVGGIAGLWVWGAWNHQQTGNFLWWITERSVGSSWDKIFYQGQGLGAGAWYMPFLSIIQVFPLILLVPHLLRKVGSTTLNKNRLMMVISGLVLFSWIFVFLMNLGYFPSPDARYFILTLPLLCIAFIYWSSQAQLGGRTIKTMITVSLGLLFIQTPTFYFFHYPLNPAIEQGSFLKELDAEANIWNDFPSATYYSQTDIYRSYSSKMLAPKDRRWDEDFEAQLALRLVKEEIAYVVYQDVAFSYVAAVWPQMKQNESFIWRQFRFEPVNIYQYQEKAQIWQRFRLLIEDGRSSSVWKLSVIE